MKKGTERKDEMKMKHKVTALVAALMSAFVLSSGRVQAAEKIDLNKDVSLTIEYMHETTPIPGAEFSVYKVADTDENTALTIKEEFKSYPVSLMNLSQKEWEKTAETYYGYIQKDSLKPVASGKTGTDGKVVLTGTSAKEMKPGLYLVSGKPVAVSGYTYKVKPMMVYLPYEESGVLNYNLVMKPKYERLKTDTTISCTVRKVWEDKGNNTGRRPESVTVVLMKDGKEFSNVELSKKNNWKFTWRDLSASSEWTVVEKSVTGYTASAVKEGNEYTITNTYNEPTPTVPGKKLPVPNTGLLWWPVGLLAAVGTVVFVVGKLHKKVSLKER